MLNYGGGYESGLFSHITFLGFGRNVHGVFISGDKFFDESGVS
jgi:hypothetical protein